MKKKMFILIILLFLLYILLFPELSVHAAGNGLILWFEQVLPSLLPFAILSNIIISSDILPSIVGKALPFIRRIMPVSTSGAFVLLSGFLFGFPMGSKNCASLLLEEKMNKQEACLILSIVAKSNLKELREAHKRLMLLNHPDNGGSTYIASKINQAKDILMLHIKQYKH